MRMTIKNFSTEYELVTDSWSLLVRRIDDWKISISIKNFKANGISCIRFKVLHLSALIIYKGRYDRYIIRSINGGHIYVSLVDDTLVIDLEGDL